MNNPLITIENLYLDLNRSMKDLRDDSSRVDASRVVLENAIASGDLMYGINTGFGGLARQRINDDQLIQLQHNLLLSHAVGVGDQIPKDITRLMLQFKIHSLGLGFSGVSPRTFDRLLDFVELDLIPFVPSKGSLGASGDLVPLAHLSLPIIGHGYFWDEESNAACPAREMLDKHGLEPLALQAKDGLALINGTQMMIGYAAYILEKASRLVKIADIVAAMGVEAMKASHTPFDQRIHEVRPHPGQVAVAENLRLLLLDSEVLKSHRNCGKVQDPYSLRCVPQVHGATRDTLAFALAVIEREMNSVTDNPLIFEDGDVLSGGNFHGQPVAYALDFMAISLAELASISERRVYLLLEGHDELPRLLMSDTGINSGFMIPQYTAAALVSENKILCHPASVDSIPTSLGQEDHVSMGGAAAVKLLQVLENVETVLAIELLSVGQALDFCKPLRPGQGVSSAHRFLRERVAHRQEDGSFENDLRHCREIVGGKGIIEAVERGSEVLN